MMLRMLLVKIYLRGYEIALNLKYGGYRRGVASMFDK